MPFAVAHAAPALPPPNPNSTSSTGGSSDPAPSTWYNQGFTDWYAKVYGDESPPSEIFGERYTAAQVQWIIWGLVSQPLNFLGKDNQSLIACAMKAMGQGTIDLSDCVTAGTTVFTNILEIVKKIRVQASITEQKTPMALIFDFNNRPISGVRYLSTLSSTYHLVSEVNAQGFGYNAIDPIKNYWSGIRNVAYALTVLVVIIFAFMIMFRVKLSPQIVISVQSALPKIITAVLLATFSYAIAGFAIDLMYVIGGLFASLLNVAGFSSNFTSAYTSIFPPADLVGLGIIGNMLAYTIIFAISVVLAFVVGAMTLAILPVTLISVIMIFVVIWLLVLCLWYAFKVPWMLIKTLISIYAAIVLAPLQIVLGAVVPSIGFNTWIKKLFADLLVFPVTGLFFFLAWSLLWTSYIYIFKVLSNFLPIDILNQIITAFGIKPLFADVIWVPSIIGFAENLAPMIWLMASFGIIVAIPKVPEIINMILLGGKFDYGTAIGEASVPVTGGVNMISGNQQRDYQRSVKNALENGGEVDSRTKLFNDFMNFVRGASGGKVK